MVGVRVRGHQMVSTKGGDVNRTSDKSPDNPGGDEPAGSAQHKDGAHTFIFSGGRYHGMRFRVYPPFDDVVFPSGVTYRLHPPIRKRGKWIFSHVEQSESHTKESA